jgi:hypothetical protein
MYRDIGKHSRQKMEKKLLIMDFVVLPVYLHIWRKKKKNYVKINLHVNRERERERGDGAQEIRAESRLEVVAGRSVSQGRPAKSETERDRVLGEREREREREREKETDRQRDREREIFGESGDGWQWRGSPEGMPKGGAVRQWERENRESWDRWERVWIVLREWEN